jgi:hypothetical protein
MFLLFNSCNDEGTPNICKKDPSNDHVPRVYEMHLTATDQAGNEAKETCTVIVFSGALLDESVCGNFAVHAGTTVTFAGGLTTIDGGDVGVSPGTAITGTPQMNNGGVIVGDSDAFAASVLAAHAAAMKFHVGEKSIAIELGGQTFTPGTYRSESAINFVHDGTVTLDGDGKYLFIAGTTLVTAADTHFILLNGAKAENVVWAIGTAATLGANSVLVGSILAGTAITFGTKSELQGCALAQSAVTFESAGYLKEVNYPAGQILADVAEDVKNSITGSTQRFDLASLSLVWSPTPVVLPTPVV